MVNISKEQSKELIYHGWVNSYNNTWIKSFEKDFDEKTSLNMIINPLSTSEDFYIDMIIDENFEGGGEFGISFSELMKELKFLGSIGLEFKIY